MSSGSIPDLAYPFSSYKKKRRAVVTDEDIVHAEDGNGNGDAKVVSGRPLKRRKSETAYARPCTKRTKELSSKKKGARVEGTTKTPSFDGSKKEKCS